MTDVLLASGGLDSTVIAAIHKPPLHLFVRYGQRNWVPEADAAQRVARHYGATQAGERLGLDMSSFGTLATSTLTGAEGFMVGPATVVPNRNAMLISLGVALAQSTGGGAVYIGCNASDHAVYPDCRPEFITASNDLAKLATGGAVTVQAPLIWLTKPQIGSLARDHGVPVDLTWSCYDPQSAGWGQSKPCGSCGACIERGKALDVHDQ